MGNINRIRISCVHLSSMLAVMQLRIVRNKETNGEFENDIREIFNRMEIVMENIRKEM